MLFSEWWIWGAAAMGLVILEILVPGYVFLGFGIGAGVGIGVSVGLAALYWVVDASTGCTQAQDGIAWAVPITTALIGTALPIAICFIASSISTPGPVPRG